MVYLVWTLYLGGTALVLAGYLRWVSPGVSWIGWAVGMSGWALGTFGRNWRRR